jgi:phosphate transport system substrate-binding protein
MHDELSKNHLVQFPQTIISIVPVVHLPGVGAGGLVLDGKTLAGIYLGNITKWNDPAIRKLNPNLHLPNIAIIPVHRSDGSGTTFNFTDYLGKASPAWKTNVGSDTSVSWPNGVGGKGNAGVAASVAQTIGSIGYVEYAYAKQTKLTYTDLINAAGARVHADAGSFQAAARHADFSHVQDFYLILTNQPGKDSWPIIAATYMLMRRDYAADRNRGVLKFLDWSLRDGRPMAEKLDYVPIPEETVKQIEASWKATLKAWP